MFNDNDGVLILFYIHLQLKAEEVEEVRHKSKVLHVAFDCKNEEDENRSPRILDSAQSARRWII